MTTYPKEALFDVHTLARYLYSLKENISPLKLQKGLYFLFAYHGAFYRNKDEEGVFEGSNGASNKYLFNAEIEAWKYGPVIREVYRAQKGNEYTWNADLIEKSVQEVSENPEIHNFINTMFSQIDAVTDFDLVNRSHEDDSWKDAYEEGKSNPMDKEQIINEYAKKYV
jgi:uncharacterized phage-associated protein